MNHIERIGIRILPHAVLAGCALLFMCVLAMACSGCGTPPASGSETDQLASQCDMMAEVAFACISPGHEPTAADHQKCRETSEMNVAIPGCFDVSTEEIACFQAFFESYTECSTATPTNVNEALVSYVQSHCPNVITNGSALHCPDFT